MSLTIADLVLVEKVISLACTRGAFRAEEMKTVGELYDKLSLFLKDAVPAENDQPLEENVEQPNKGDSND